MKTAFNLTILSLGTETKEVNSIPTLPHTVEITADDHCAAVCREINSKSDNTDKLCPISSPFPSLCLFTIQHNISLVRFKGNY